MFTYGDARGMQDTHSDQVTFYMCFVGLLLFFPSAKKYKRMENIIEKSLENREKKKGRYMK